MRDDRLRRLIEVVYDAAIDPGAWASVMAILKQHFFTNGETFYFLDFPRHAMRPLHVDGIGPSYYRAFPDWYNKGALTRVLHGVAGTRGSRESPCPRWR